MRQLSALLVLVCTLVCSGCAARCISGDCKNGYGTLQALNGDAYTGYLVNGKFNGQGTLTALDGKKYVGEFRNGKPNGQGTMTWADGRKHVGEFLDSKRVGLGTATYTNGRTLTGMWSDHTTIGKLNAAEFAAISPVSINKPQHEILDNLSTERQRLERERISLVAEQKQILAESERQRLEEEKAQLERQKAELAELRKKPKQTPLRPKMEGTKERRTALVIGNSAYVRGPLKNPANDARDMAAALKHLGFDVTTLTDATQPQMEHAVRDFGTKLRQGGVGLFYYAGHGVQVAGENYLVPVNAVIQSEGDVKYGSVNAGLVLAKMEDAGNGLNIVILDACRSNPFARSFRTSSEGLAKMDAPTGSIIAYSTAPGSVASDGSGRNGVFTRHLLENMKEPGLPISEVLMRVRQGVVKETAKRQVPWEASSLIGQFYFAE